MKKQNKAVVTTQKKPIEFNIEVDLDFHNARMLKAAVEKHGISANEIMNACVRRHLAGAEQMNDLKILSQCLRDSVPKVGYSLETQISGDLDKKLKAMAKRLAVVMDDFPEWGVEAIVNAALRNFFREA